MKRTKFGLTKYLAIPALVLITVLAGCSTLSRALVQLSLGTTTDSGTSSSSESPTPDNSTSNQGSVPGYSPMQLQFYSIYAISAPFGGYKSAGSEYKPGQGTVWELSGKKQGDVTTIEHALLKVNTDGSQWWRIQLTSGSDSLLYEFLVASDEKITKVRYKDPDSGKIMEFVPDSSRTSAQSYQGTGGMPPSNARSSTAKVTTDRQTVSVRAGRFPAEHTTYLDDKQGYKSETWTSAQVPGGMVKYLATNLKSGDTSQGELIKIESGVTTVLESF
ncbi:MAG TPA: hypothetical protein VMW69_14275 [Spirochaetia bacterium]|nr:hypothetical protein [Spirochaetia bacterium]